MREKIIEEKLTKAVKQKGGVCWKFMSPGTAGVPDRIVLMPKGHIAFVNVGISVQSCNAFFCCSNSYTVSQVLQMIPFLHFCRPCISCYSQRCNNQNFSDLKQIVHQVVDSSQCCYGFVNLSPCQGKELLSYVPL